jgi:hypothetical protein
MSNNRNITAVDADISSLEVGYYRAGSNKMDETPKTPIKRGTDTNTWGPPRQGYKSVERLPETSGDYFIPGTHK